MIVAGFALAIAAAAALLVWAASDLGGRMLAEYRVRFTRDTRFSMRELFLFADPARLYAINLAFMLLAATAAWLLTHTPRSIHWYQWPLARLRSSARAAFTSALISSTVIGGMPAAATRSAIDSSASAACLRRSASFKRRDSISGVNRPASRAACAVASGKSI